MTILLLFFCSGATALVYEVIWSRYLTLLFGSTIQAQTVVLAIFMGGLALGNRLFGHRADRSPAPLALYGYLEVSIGLYAFFFSLWYQLADGVFAGVGSKLLEHAGWLLLLKGVLSAALLLGPTILMGGTLPVLAAWLQRHTADAGRRSARFYAINSLGAVCGAGLAGFFLVTWLGLPTTLQMTALVNVGIGFIAVGISRVQGRQGKASEQPKASSNPVAPVAPGGPVVLRWGCLLVALTGAVSMGLEVLASRCLCLIFGASLQAFAIVLMAFILGIGLGSAAISAPRRKAWSKETTTFALVLGAAAWLGLLVYNIETLVEIYRQARSGLGASSMGYRYNQIIAALFSMFVLGIPAAALGSVLPLWIRVVSETSDFLGDRVGRLLTWNTLGAVGGVLLTGFVLMPKLGLRGSFAGLALVLASAALLVAWAMRRRVMAGAAAVVAGLLVLVAATGGDTWRLVLNSGVFRWRETEVTAAPMQARLKYDRILFYEDAADATVSVEDDTRPGSQQRLLRVNGKTDASTHFDYATQLLVAHLPLVMKPESKEAFVFGMGSGISAGAMLGYPLERLTVAENCEPVLRAAQFFAPWNNGVLTNARVRLYGEDARTVLKLSSQKYDVIVAEPSNPWTVGIGSVFSREFYELAASRLKPDGIMAQWFHVYEMNDGIVELVVRTFGQVFPVMEIWDANGGDLIMLGSMQPWKSDREAYRRAFALAEPRRDLTRIGVASPEALLARQFASQRTAFAVSGAGPIQTDDFPVLEYEAPKALYLGRSAQRLHRFDERTWQLGMAPLEKNTVLAALSPADLKAVFCGAYNSVNPELNVCLQWHLGRLGAGNSNSSLTLPCVFEGTISTVLSPPLCAATNPIVRQLFEAEVALQAPLSQPAQALDRIEALLEQVSTCPAQEEGWSPGHYASLAVKASLRLGDAARAKKALLRGLQLEPESDTLQYLARIMMREGSLKPADLVGSPSAHAFYGPGQPML